MSQTNVMDSILNHLQNRGILFVPRFAPYFISSFGCHVFNLVNKQNQVYTEHGRVADTRLHELFVAPPGFFKSMCMKMLLNPVYGVLNAMDSSGRSIVPMHFESMITEGGWTGSFGKDKNGAIIPMKGLAEEYSSGIVGIEEFSAVTQTIKQQHSLTLDAALLTTLDSGEVRKRMVSGSIAYESNITVWAGTQQGRFDLSSGLGRRFFFLNWVPSTREANDLKIAYWQGQNVRLDVADLDHIRTLVSNVVDRVDKIKSVSFDEGIKNDLMDCPHFEHSLFARLCLGYQIMTGQFSDKLEVHFSDNMRSLLTQAKVWREHLLTEAEGDQVIQILLQAGGEARGWDICARMLGFGSSAAQTRNLLWRLANRARLVSWDEKTDMVKLRTPNKA
jgi:hypothetical protein